MKFNFSFSNINMNILALILYLCGIIGILVFFLFIILALRKKTKASLTLSIVLLFLSMGLLGSGSYFKIRYDKENPPANTIVQNHNTSNQSSNETLSEKKPSIEDLKFNYNLSSFDSNTKQANMTIKNSSESIFNGQVEVDFLNSSDQLINSMTLQVKDLVPNKTYSPDVLVSSDITTLEYKFSGTFSENNIKEIPYTINQMSTGNKFIRINVSVNNTSKNHLEQICNEIAFENSDADFNGLLVYFYPENCPSNNLNFNDLVADYYLNNITKTSTFTYYD